MLQIADGAGAPPGAAVTLRLPTGQELSPVPQLLHVCVSTETSSSSTILPYPGSPSSHGSSKPLREGPAEHLLLVTLKIIIRPQKKQPQPKNMTKCNSPVLGKEAFATLRSPGSWRFPPQPNPASASSGDHSERSLSTTAPAGGAQQHAGGVQGLGGGSKPDPICCRACSADVGQIQHAPPSHSGHLVLLEELQIPVCLGRDAHGTWEGYGESRRHDFADGNVVPSVLTW